MRKYRQHGYEDNRGRRERPRRSSGPRPSGPRPSRGGPRSPRMTKFHQVIRCSMCGGTLPPSFSEVGATSQCPKCATDLHTCKNCVYFDPGARFECSEPVPQRVANKNDRNDCRFFEIRTAVEKATTSVRERPLEPREMFERLFRK